MLRILRRSKSEQPRRHPGMREENEGWRGTDMLIVRE
jgi:hypothetical protein